LAESAVHFVPHYFDMERLLSNRRAVDSMDDWTNGRWIDSKSHIDRNENTYVFTFAPVSAGELNNLPGNGVNYRKTLWIRVHSKSRLKVPA